MAKRRSLNDDIHGDRSEIRTHREFGDTQDFGQFLDKGHESDSSWLLDSSYKTKGGSTVLSPSHGKGWADLSCYNQHPPMKVPGTALLDQPGTEKVIYGGSCLHPVVTDASVYIGFDSGMAVSKKSYPWNGGHEVLFKIVDGGVPTDVAEFKKLVAWSNEQLLSGAKIHCGCIGGHGRTGIFLAALCAVNGEKDAIVYVRKNYCPKAVENSKQVKFLVEHFGVTPVVGEQRKDWLDTPKTKLTPIKGGYKSVKTIGSSVDTMHRDTKSLLSIWR